MTGRPVYVPRYTRADYRQWQGDWQLIDGVAIAMTPSPFGPHERVVSRLSRIIGTQLEAGDCRCEVYTNLDWIVSDDTVIRPDLMVVCGEQPQQHLERVPAVAVEVLSDSTRGQDLVVKRALYREQGVRDYLVIDPAGRTVEQVSGSATMTFAPPATITLALGSDGSCRVTIPCDRLFD